MIVEERVSLMSAVAVIRADSEYRLVANRPITEGELLFSIEGELTSAPNRYTVWVAPTTLTDADIVVGEGRQIVFVEPGALPDLELSDSSAHFVLAFLDSPEYADLAREAAR